jgi:uncharacterized protein (DUF2237 family)
LLTNSVAVIGEVNEATSIDSIYKDGICASRYEDLVSHCVALVDNEQLREQLQRKAFDSISQCPQSLFTQEVLA